MKRNRRQNRNRNLKENRTVSGNRPLIISKSHEFHFGGSLPQVLVYAASGGLLWRCSSTSISKIYKCKNVILWENKKVLLCERKRHTDRGVSSTPSVVLYWGSTPAGGYPTLGNPPVRPGQGGPHLMYHCRTWPGGILHLRYPPVRPGPGGTPPWVPPGWTWLGYPPPPSWTWLGYPPQLDLAGITPPARSSWGTPPSWTWLGYPPPPVDRQMDRHVSKHNLPVVLRTRSVMISKFLLATTVPKIQQSGALSPDNRL